MAANNILTREEVINIITHESPLLLIEGLTLGCDKLFEIIPFTKYDIFDLYKHEEKEVQKNVFFSVPTNEGDIMFRVGVNVSLYDGKIAKLTYFKEISNFIPLQYEVKEIII